MNWDCPPRCDSPAFVPKPLPIRPRSSSRKPATRTALAIDAKTPPLPSADSAPPSCPSTPDSTDALHILCRSLNVLVPPPIPSSDVPPTLELSLAGSARHPLPTHVLAVYDAQAPGALATLIPVDGGQLARRLRADVLGPAAAAPRPIAGARAVSVPVVPVAVPHAPSMPTLLLFALGVRTSARCLTCSLLPLAASDELPSVAGAARAMAGVCAGEAGRGRMAAFVAANQGVWKNALALGPRDESIMAAVQLVWNITVEARRLAARVAAPAGQAPSPLT